MSAAVSLAPTEPLTIALTANFTAEPVEPALAFWMQELEIPARIVFAPYNQVFQELLVPSSLLAKNPEGINVVLLRLEDWSRDKPGANGEVTVPYQMLERNVRDLLRGLRGLVIGSPAFHLLCLCPASPAAAANPEHMAIFQRLEAHIVVELGDVPGVHVVTTAELSAGYPVADYYDPQADKVAHVPYKPVFYSALGTMIARKIHALQNTRYKVIVLDADHTLWGGICGEDGPAGVRIDGEWRAVQEFLLEQQDKGLLLCLCSKNNEEDVDEVFARRPEMVLLRRHFVAWRINWRAKSENIQSLARELGLGLGSFIFLDDDPVECAEVQATCPEVLTLLLPQDPGRLAKFLRNVWAFDRLKVTGEGRERTSLYRQNSERQGWQQKSLTLKDFLAGLGLVVRISALEAQHLERVAELTQRTNQFNLTTIRRSEAELQRLCQAEGMEGLVVHAQDRFGDYGLVGVILFRMATPALSVDSFLLSCRALGKGVEYRMLARLGAIALQRGLGRIDVSYIRTRKNEPALAFLEEIGTAFREPQGAGFLFGFPAEVAAALPEYPPSADRSPFREHLPLAPALMAADPVTDTRAQAIIFRLIATDLSDPEKIHQAVVAQIRKAPALKTDYAAPRTPTEEELAKMFGALLAIDRVGIHDNFFSLGGDSLLATQLLSRIREAFQVELSPRLFFTGEVTVAELAKTVGMQQIRQADPQQIAALLQRLDGLSDDEVEALLTASGNVG